MLRARCKVVASKGLRRAQGAGAKRNRCQQVPLAAGGRGSGARVEQQLSLSQLRLQNFGSEPAPKRSSAGPGPSHKATA